jgi:hypothetical protein
MDQQEETPVSPQESDQPNQITLGNIEANEIRAINVVSGVQYIETQAVHYHNEVSRQRKPPLQRPLRAEYFTDRNREQYWLLVGHLSRLLPLFRVHPLMTKWTTTVSSTAT